MSIHVYLEVDIGDILRIIRPDRKWAGKALTTFTTTYSNYEILFNTNSQEIRWFKRFEELAKILPRPITEVIYSGDWNFNEDEYDRFIRFAEDNPFTNEQEFRDGIKALNKLWIPIGKLTAISEEILKVLPEMGDPTYWFSPQDTVFDFQGLLNTLLLAQRRDGEMVRIKCV